MANIYKSNYTGQQIDNSINKIINIIPQEKLTPGDHISIKDNIIDVTTINGLAGGTLTSPLIITGGDQSSASKIILDPKNKGQITDNSTNTLFGFMSSGDLTIGSNTYNTIIRGGNNSSIGGKLFSSLAQNSDIKNGILTIKLGADGTTTVKDTFSANQAENSTITLPVYSKEEINEMITGAVQYLGSIVDADALIKKTPNSIGDFCRATQDFQLPAANSITTISVNVHTSDILICELLNNSGNKWSVVHGENWQGNTQTTDGYVTAGGSNFNKVWKTDASGVPGWRDDANTDTGITSIEVTGDGNAITSASISERKMTLNKDTTFITSSELPAAVSANPTLSDSDTELTGLQIGSTKYKIPTGGNGDVTAALNENIIKDPSKTYLVWKGNQFPNSTNATFKAPAGCTIDWGDGNVETFETASTAVNTHTYSDGIEYHLISLSNYASIGNYAFEYCSGLTSITIPDSVTSIGGYAFYGCRDLTSVTIPNSVTSIGGYAFYDCRGLTSVTIPDSVTSIGGGAFYGCIGLKTIKISAINPPTLGSNTFSNASIEKIIVPKSTINAYKSAEGWSTYANKIVYEVDSSDLSGGGGGDVTAAGDNTFTGTNTFTSGSIVVSKTDWTNKTTKAEYGSSAIAYTPYGETMSKLISLPAEEGTLALTKELPAANVTLSGSESILSSLKIGDTTYKVTTINDIPTVTHKYLHQLYIKGRDEEGVNFVICAMHISNSETIISTFAQLLSAASTRRMMATGYCGTTNSIRPVYSLQQSPDNSNVIRIYGFMDTQESDYDIGPDAIPNGGIIDSVFII